MFPVCSPGSARASAYGVAGYTSRSEGRMDVERLSPGDIGLRHLLENGLHVAQGQDVEDAERQQVLDNLLRVFSEADRGSEAFGTHNLTPIVNEKRALKRFSSFYHLLRHDFGDEVPGRLGEAKLAITE